MTQKHGAEGECRHTPGPWEIERTAHVDLWITAPDGRHIVGTVSCGGDQKTEGRANARLIAAAPDMLAALEAVIHAAFEPTWAQLVADAIARAKGE
jgi:hypothetical protein